MSQPAVLGRPRIHDDRVRAVIYLRPDQKDDLAASARKTKLSISEMVAWVLTQAGVMRP